MRILTDKKLQEIIDSHVSEAVSLARMENCESGNHVFETVFNRVRNSYQPQYMSGSGNMGFLLLKRSHDSEEREMCFDKIYVGNRCKYCGHMIKC